MVAYIGKNAKLNFNQDFRWYCNDRYGCKYYYRNY